MGSEYCQKNLPGHLTAAEVREAFYKLVEQAVYECGQGGYSGTLAEKYDLAFVRQDFKEEAEAEQYLEENAEKWGPALAVKVAEVHGLQRFPVTRADFTLQEKVQKLRANIDGFDKEVIERSRQQKAKNKACKKCYSQISLRALESVDCPVCGGNLLITETDKKRRSRLYEKQNLLSKKIQMRESTVRAERKMVIKPGWIIGARCSS
jgi:rRNA maturation endonuclease Nob1